MTSSSRLMLADREEQARDWLLVCVIVLLAVGLLAVFSAGYVRGLSEGGGARFSLVATQFCFMLLGGVALLVTYCLPQKILRGLSLPLLIITFILLCLVLIVGKEVRGGMRWLQVGPFNLQPSEFAKIALVLWVSSVYSRRPSSRAGQVRFRVPFVVLCLFSLLVLAEPHVGNAALIALGGMSVMYFAGVRLSKLVAGATLVIILGALAIGGSWAVRPDTWGKKWQEKRERIVHFYSEGGVEATRFGEGYQSFQSILAIGSGGWAGKGVGASRAKFNYLPDGHTDFIYAILGEEMGFWACLLVLLCFVGITMEGLSLGLQSKDRFGGLLLCGLSVMLGLQALINIAMATAWLPAIGLPLPFISYGGSSLLSSMMAVGLMLRASRFEPGAEWTGRRL